MHTLCIVLHIESKVILPSLIHSHSLHPCGKKRRGQTTNSILLLLHPQAFLPSFLTSCVCPSFTPHFLLFCLHWLFFLFLLYFFLFFPSMSHSLISCSSYFSFSIFFFYIYFSLLAFFTVEEKLFTCANIIIIS